ELRILELKKLPVRTEGEKLLISWMRFFAAKTRKEMRIVAQTDEYIDEAFEELEKLSADKQKWMEYEARQKAIRDYNTQVQSYWEDGLEEGQRQLKMELIKKKMARGKTLEQIADDLETDVESIRALAEEISGETPPV
ncbi:MAG TPA: PD-(D/E)XK nuclease family transposase, partial [Candidatus Pullilachnospira stercoravium]|nr:PD-(D/E)XK nuclease family transposase [Candidatus Pullilachnospira stercoravium]